MAAHEVQLFDLITEFTEVAKNEGEIIVRKLMVTPQMAASALSTQRRNRKPQKSRVEGFVRLIKTGKFRLTGQGIAFDLEGRLADGQHRLRAIVEANLGATMFASFGLDENDVAVLDEGKSRTVTDKAKMAGIEGPVTRMARPLIWLSTRNALTIVRSGSTTATTTFVPPFDCVLSCCGRDRFPLRFHFN